MFAAAAMVVGAMGCQPITRTQPPAPVNDTPLVVDEAMQLRDWERSTNYYANGATIAGGTAYVWQVHKGINPGHRRFVEVPVAVLNIASMPVGVFVNSPFEKQVIRGETIPPTYTAQPPLPGEPGTSSVAAPEVMETPAPAEPAAPPAELAPVAEPSAPPAAPPAIVTPAEPAEPTPPAQPSQPVTPTEPVAPVEPPAPVAPVAPDTTTTSPTPTPADTATPTPAPPPPQ
jgi:hypothetical protein